MSKDEAVNQDEKKLECKVEITDSGSWKKKISIEIPRAEIDKQLDEQYQELRNSAVLPGFRKGRAPRRLMEKRFGEDVSDQAKLRLLAQAFEQIEEEQDFEILGEPDLKPEDIELPAEGDFKFEYEIEVKPEFELPELEGIEVAKQVVDIDEKRVTDEIEQICRNAGKHEDVDKSKENDMVRCKATLKVEGVEEEEVRDDVPMRAGANALMGIEWSELEKGLVGVKVGDVVKAKSTAPDTHSTEDYRGKQAELTMEVKAVRRLKPAELNDDLFGRLGVSDEAELRERIEEMLEDRSDKEARQSMAQQIRDYLNSKVDFELPAGVAARHAQRFLMQQYYQLVQMGVPVEKLEENMEHFRTSSSEQSAAQLKSSFIMDAVCEKLEIDISESEVNAFIAQIASQQARRPERVRDEMAQSGRINELARQIRDEKAIDKILEMAKVVDAPAEATADAASTDNPEDTKKKTSKKTTKRKPPKKSENE